MATAPLKSQIMYDGSIRNAAGTTNPDGVFNPVQAQGWSDASFGGGSGAVGYGPPPPAPTAPAAANGLANLGGQVGQLAAAGQNPWLQQMGNTLSSQLQQQYQNTTAPALASQALAAGGYGSSRQGVIEANALNNLQKNTGDALTNLYGQGYNTGLQYDLGLRNNQLGQTQAANSYDLGLRNNASQYDLGLRNNDLQYAGLDRQIYNDNMGWQLQGAQLGLGLLGQLQSGNALGQQAGGAIQNTPLNYWQNFNNQANSVGQGFASQSQSGGGGGNPLLGALGGAQLGQSIYNSWNSGQQSGPALGSNGYSGDGGFFGGGGWGTGTGGVGS